MRCRYYSQRCVLCLVCLRERKEAKRDKSDTVMQGSLKVFLCHSLCSCVFVIYVCEWAYIPKNRPPDIFLAYYH